MSSGQNQRGSTVGQEGQSRRNGQRSSASSQRPWQPSYLNSARSDSREDSISSWIASTTLDGATPAFDPASGDSACGKPWADGRAQPDSYDLPEAMRPNLPLGTGQRRPGATQPGNLGIPPNMEAGPYQHRGNPVHNRYPSETGALNYDNISGANNIPAESGRHNLQGSGASSRPQLPVSNSAPRSRHHIRFSQSKAQQEAPAVSSAEPLPRGRWRGSPPKTSKSQTKSLAELETVVPVPAPTLEYLERASNPSMRLDEPQSLLLVIDLNGTLLFRRRANRSGQFSPRLDMDAFVRFILSKFSVMVWSSAKPVNVDAMCRQIFNADQRKLVIAEWARDKLGLNSWQYNQKVQVYKALEAVWENKAISASFPNPDSTGGRWDQSNTVLVDDSILKAAAQPYNIIEVPEFTGDESKKVRALRQVATYLEQLRWQSNVSSYMKETPFVMDTLWNTREIIEDFDQ
ncbi:MAG: putative tRNA threonylcarbamoyladenosine biosynthesis protein kae1 [Chaenotheca gracillima]|nr:MAG: putative tRNA threonylcarbamoyladenosine biosynthesis protein kae1 [Chaenotheca gracillima]